MTEEYPAIRQLRELQGRLGSKITPVPGKYLQKEYYPLVHFELKGTIYPIYVDDEYTDLELDNPLLNLCLVLRALENYLDAEDYLVWCTQHGMDSGDSHAREYHMGLRSRVQNIQKWIDPIDSFISDFDFELNAGAAQYLRRTT